MSQKIEVVVAKNRGDAAATAPNQPKKAPPPKKKPKRKGTLEALDDCAENYCGDESRFTIAPCHCWCMLLLMLLVLLGLGLGLVLGGVVGDEVSMRALAFLPLWMFSLAALPCYVFCVAARYTDDDDWGCGFGDYDEGPGNMACAMTSTILCLFIAGCVGGSAAAISIGANPNSTYVGL